MTVALGLAAIAVMAAFIVRFFLRIPHYVNTIFEEGYLKGYYDGRKRGREELFHDFEKHS